MHDLAHKTNMNFYIFVFLSGTQEHINTLNLGKSSIDGKETFSFVWGTSYV